MKQVLVLFIFVCCCTVLHAAKLDDDILAGNLSAVTADVKAGQSVNQVFSDGFTPLLLAVDSGFSDIVVYLLSANANVNYAKADDGYTALHIAAQNDNLEIVKLLLGKNANKEAKTAAPANDYAYDLAPSTEVQQLLIPDSLAK